ncbi:hypothetical protein WM04_07360 [Burkholderia ubonensis]|nr:hypothetical protein WM04_07360 [Burkholderia ubonensis]OJB17434.1 hypothetical protein BGV53_14720 [Burkholderia ubonensis]
MTPFCGSASVSVDRPGSFHSSAPIDGAVLVLVSDGMQNPYQHRRKRVRRVAAGHRHRVAAAGMPGQRRNRSWM